MIGILRISVNPEIQQKETTRILRSFRKPSIHCINGQADRKPSRRNNGVRSCARENAWAVLP